MSNLPVLVNDPLINNDIYDWIGVRQAWNYSKGSSSLGAIILDSGVDLNHPDLQGNADGTIYASGYNGAHGSMVASVFAKEDNGIGTAGIAPHCKFKSALITLADTSGVGENAVDSSAVDGAMLYIIAHSTSLRSSGYRFINLSSYSDASSWTEIDSNHKILDINTLGLLADSTTGASQVLAWTSYLSTYSKRGTFYVTNGTYSGWCYITAVTYDSINSVVRYSLTWEATPPSSTTGLYFYRVNGDFRQQCELLSAQGFMIFVAAGNNGASGKINSFANPSAVVVADANYSNGGFDVFSSRGLWVDITSVGEGMIGLAPTTPTGYINKVNVQFTAGSNNVTVIGGWTHSSSSSINAFATAYVYHSTYIGAQVRVTNLVSPYTSFTMSSPALASGTAQITLCNIMYYAQASGTSYASPVAMACAMLIASYFPSATNAQILTALKSTARYTGNITSTTGGAGLIDVNAAIGSFAQSVSVVSTGGAVISSSASVSRGCSVIGSGGIVCGGVAQISSSQNGTQSASVQSAGGAVISGTAPISRGIQIWGSGGFIAAGTAIVSCNSIKSTIVIKLWDGSYTQLKLAA